MDESQKECCGDKGNLSVDVGHSSLILEVKMEHLLSVRVRPVIPATLLLELLLFYLHSVAY